MPADLSPTTTKGRTPTVIRVLVLATFVVILNETIMINAIPRLMADLHVTEVAAQWVSTAFMLTMAAIIPTTGWFLQRVTTRQAYATAMGVFIAGTVISALAPSFAVLLIGRIIQAGGTAVMMPLLMTTLMTVVAEQDRGRVMGNVTLAISVAPAMGPVISGLILQVASWRWLFVIMLPIAGLVTWLGLRQLENVGEPQAGRIDVLSVALAALGFGGLVFGLSKFHSGSYTTPALIVAGGVALVAAFALRQIQLQRNGTPLLDLRVLLSGTYSKALVLMAVAFLAMMGSMILLPLYLQNLRHLSPLETGLLVMPGGLAMGLLGPTVGRLFDKFGGRMLVIPGSIGIAVSLAGFTQISLTMPYWQLLALHILLMVSLAAAFTPVFTLGLGALPMHLYSHGSSMLGTLQQVAAAFGTALVVTVMSARSTSLIDAGTDPTSAALDGMRLAFLVSAALALIVIAMAVLLPNRAAGNPHGAQDETPSDEPEQPVLVKH
ncbi:MDR family MFS transporter [Nocardia asteroides]|uniref:Drug resistance transporter n=1 Tax=Nocardia asteroides NBRC 15531 TaxID=1110697 RepID=U5EC05_NOCAS|nr:MDR family MFS transporter [Nocardia asteroides]TLF69864.1 multidrug efflux MFS transporter [Nocardia asteroides NBRC 15531]UGT49368.1 multidrug efflux MFS transporter [Nocardia asteroides]SFL88056.1 MFS transporter, DHA2 family, lincomycin resistance protein [Nocardia asteroides]VEG38163.1 High-copy suppressor of rspA [Nocardia asteroides]GAD83961.1 putative drug resistance transporter [Nocardia asteroides NBRC 15531]